MGRIALTVVLAMGLASFVGWSLGLFSYGPDDSGNSNYVHQPVAAAESLGDWMFPPAKEQRNGKFHRVERGSDAIVLAGNLVERDKIDIPSQVAGAVLYIGDGVPEGVSQLAGIAPFMNMSYQQASVLQAGREIIKFYRPLRKGDEVFSGQIVAEIDYAKAINLYLSHKSLVERAKAELLMTYKMDAAAKELLEMTLSIGKSAALRELIESRLTSAKTAVDIEKAEKEVEKEGIELDNARNLLAFHELRFKLPVKSGFIKYIYHDTGEAVKENEPVLQIYGTERLMAEALVESQYTTSLRKNMTATLEPAYDEMPLRMFEGHRANAAITGVGFITAGKDLVVVSASEDGFLKLWRQDYKGAIENVNHREPIRALACSPSSAQQPLCATGTGDGKIHLWSFVLDEHAMPRLTKLFEQPLEGHRDSVSALAFSADGKLLASGAADGSIKLWQATDGKLIYAFDAAHGVDSPHQGAITALSFTPQCRLVSASRDNTLRVWNVKEKGAHLEGTPITGRSGTIHQLGVSQDGRFMFFDQGKSLQLMTVPDGQTINSLKNPGGSTPFETLALFSPDSSLVLTGGATEGRLQLWRAPSDANRGYEVRQFVTEQRSPVTCAAFAPAVGATGETAFAASGTKDGFVYLWPILSKKDADHHRITNVPVTLVSQGTDAGSRQFRIGVEVPNPTGRLSPGRPVTIVME